MFPERDRSARQRITRRIAGYLAMKMSAVTLVNSRGIDWPPGEARGQFHKQQQLKTNKGKTEQKKKHRLGFN